ncbi:MAG: outer membrane protein assembly factor BamA [Deltaproteobacteria bacterium]|nr:outer membrane protein assembly factor BamA [Deltaproteobacteria bacterium]
MKNGTWNRLFLSLVLVLALAWQGSAETRSYDIGEVQVRGNQRVERGSILSVVRVAPGPGVTAEAIDQDIRAIFGLGRFEDVSVEVGEVGGTYILTYVVKERPLLRTVRLSGNKELKTEVLEGVLGIRTPELFDPMKIEGARENLRKRYQSEGFYAAEVSSSVAVDDKLEATVTFNIAEGEKNRIAEILFNGNTVFSDRKLRKAMETKEKWLFSWIFDSGKYNEEIARIDRERIADLYYNEGYVDILVSDPRLSLTPNRKHLLITYDIEEGQQYSTGSIGVEGDLIDTRETLVGLVKLKEGDVFSRKKLRESVLAINDFYADRGHAYVNVVPRTPTDKKERRIDLQLRIEKGELVHFDRIQIRGNTKTRDKVIRREMKVNEGDLYTTTGLKESQRLIKNLGFFEEVSVATSKADEPTRMNVDVDIKERPTGTLSAGVGYSSVDNFVFQGSASQDNFLGLGLRGQVGASLGGSSSTYRIGLLDPYFLDRNLTLGFDIYKTEREWTSFSRDALGGNVKVGFPLPFENNRAFLIYRFEKKDIYDVDDDASFYIREQQGKSTLSSIQAMLIRDTRDYKLDPKTGYITTLSAEYAGLGGTEHFAKYAASHRHFWPLPWLGLVFSVNGEIGYIQKTTDDEIPIDEKFFLGGLYSLRGFESREVGPRDPQTGDYYGGVKEAFFNFELIFPLVKDIDMKGVVFFDTGNAWDENEDYFQNMRYSAGFGIRWFSPMGPLRIEWGYNLDPEEWEDKSQIDFSLGRMF